MSDVLNGIEKIHYMLEMALEYLDEAEAVIGTFMSKQAGTLEVRKRIMSAREEAHKLNGEYVNEAFKNASRTSNSMLLASLAGAAISRPEHAGDYMGLAEFAYKETLPDDGP